MKQNSRNYYINQKQMCSKYHHPPDKLPPENFQLHDSANDDPPPPATNIKVADTVILDSKGTSLVTDQDNIKEQRKTEKVCKNLLELAMLN